MKICQTRDCVAANREIAAGKFCHECGGLLVEKDCLPWPRCANAACPNSKPLLALTGACCQECGGKLIFAPVAVPAVVAVGSGDATIREPEAARLPETQNLTPASVPVAAPPAVSEPAGESELATDDILARLEAFLSEEADPADDKLLGNKKADSTVGTTDTKKSDVRTAAEVHFPNGQEDAATSEAARHDITEKSSPKTDVDKFKSMPFGDLNDAALHRGEAAAQFELGLRHWDGRGLPQGVETSQETAAVWFSRAAEQGFANAQFHLGRCHFDGVGGYGKDYRRALEWYQKAADQGYSGAQNKLGDCYLNGYWVAKDKAVALAWYQKSAELGDSSGQFNLGCCFEFGRGVKVNKEEAAKWYQKAAEQNNADAKEKLEFAKEKLEFQSKPPANVIADKKLAVAWYRKAAELGNADAQNSLGECYFGGVGIEGNKNEAAKWFRKAADQGYAEAQYHLGN